MAARVSYAARTVVSVDVKKKKPWEQHNPLHNRWHPDIPCIAEVACGELFRLEMLDCTGGQIADNDSAEDGHLLSGPIQVKDSRGVPAKPGDLLVVEICNLGPLTANEWGVTATYERENGGGFLTDHSPCASKAIWHFEGIFAQSRHIPGVYFPGLIHPGLIGTAPSHELLDIWNERERDLVQQGEKAIATAAIIHIRPLTALPTSQNTLLGKIEAGTLLWEKIVQEAAGTVPARENGGNCDIKNLIKGSWV